MRIIAFFVFLVIILFPICAQDSDELDLNSKKNKTYGFSIGTQFGFIHGEALELVYPVSGNTKNDLYSELIWDMKPVFYLGLKADFGKKDIMSSPGFFASASFKVGIPSDSGVMEDRDWTSPKDDSLTHFSSHTNKTKEIFMADLLLGATIPVKSYFYIKPFISGSWMHFSFSGRDGYGTYEFKNWEVIPFYGEVITYQQDWLLAAAGFSIGTKILSPFLFELSFKTSPLTYCAAIDHHKDKSKKIEYRDFTSFGFYIEPEINVSFFIKQVELSLGFAYRYIGNTKGDTYIKGNEETEFIKYSDIAGAGLSIIDTRLLVIWHF